MKLVIQNRVHTFKELNFYWDERDRPLIKISVLGTMLISEIGKYDKV